jgi:hypothetical protein
MQPEQFSVGPAPCRKGLLSCALSLSFLQLRTGVGPGAEFGTGVVVSGVRLFRDELLPDCYRRS